MNILIEKFKQRNEISTIFLYILYFLLGMYYPLFSFMRQTVPQYWNQVTLFYHILLILLLVKVILQKNSVLDCFFLLYCSIYVIRVINTIMTSTTFSAQ